MKSNNIMSLCVSMMALAILTLCFSCKPSIPGKYIKASKMEDILYDCHLADALYNQEGGDSLTLLAYRASIFKKYGVTEAEFDSSLVYYTRHTKLLHDIYESLAERVNGEMVAQGGARGALSQYGDMTAGTDSFDVWNGDRCFVLSPYAMSNNFQFELKADSSYHKGDHLILDFDTQFIYQDGTRNAVVVMAVTFDNDSISSRYARISSTSHYNVQIMDNDKLGIKSIKGYFLLSNNDTGGYSTTLRLCIFSNVKLLRMHMDDVHTATSNADSAKVMQPNIDRMPNKENRVRVPQNSAPPSTAKTLPMPEKANGNPPIIGMKPTRPVSTQELKAASKQK